MQGNCLYFGHCGLYFAHVIKTLGLLASSKSINWRD